MSNVIMISKQNTYPQECNQKQIIVVTPTYKRAEQLQYLRRCLGTFSQIPNLIWIIVEDSKQKSNEICLMLDKSEIRFLHLCIGPTERWGNSQRDLGLDYIVNQNLKGVVYLADDDNYYELKLFDEIRKTRRVAILPVGHLGPLEVERPIVRRGEVVQWHADWTQRKYPVNMAGFAFSAALLHALKKPYWIEELWGGETEFLERIINREDEIEFLCDDCKQCYVWHNQPLNEKPRQTRLRRRPRIRFYSLCTFFYLLRYSPKWGLFEKEKKLRAYLNKLFE
jgi:hypothetical protein